MGQLQERQGPIFQRLAKELMAATPEHWTRAVLELTAPEVRLVAGMEQGCKHQIKSPDFPGEPMMPTDELYEVTYELEKLSQEFGDNWKKVVFQIEQKGDTWSYDVQFERASRAKFDQALDNVADVEPDAQDRL